MSDAFTEQQVVLLEKSQAPPVHLARGVMLVPEEKPGPRIRLFQKAQQPKQCRFPRAVRSYNRHLLAVIQDKLVDLQGEPVAATEYQTLQLKLLHGDDPTSG